MDDTYPQERPPMPSILKGVATVKSSSDSSISFSVDFNTGECDCKHGAGWRWSRNRYTPNSLCNHKLRAIGSLLLKEDTEELRNYYITQLGKSYNVFVAVSCMHKELRRGDTDAALYWATMMLPHRGTHGVVAYLRNILFEETRDLKLGKYILKLSSYGRDVTIHQMQKAVIRFCKAPKKWELPWRYDIFIDEMRGYKKLAKNYGYEIAKGKNIIEPTAATLLEKKLIDGFNSGDRVDVQIGLKGWFKTQSPNHDHMKIDILNTLIDVYNEDLDNKFDTDKTYCDELYDFIMLRLRNHGSPGYHELNAFCDALTGESACNDVATLTSFEHKKIINSPTVYQLPLGVKKNPPLYAHDNHTHKGKALMRRYGAAELQPSADQTHLDFRICGAYMGVAWRTLAYKQHSTINCKWGDVSWKTPNWLWSHLDSMWY